MYAVFDYHGFCYIETASAISIVLAEKLRISRSVSYRFDKYMWWQIVVKKWRFDFWGCVGDIAGETVSKSELHIRLVQLLKPVNASGHVLCHVKHEEEMEDKWNSLQGEVELKELLRS